MGKKIKHSDLFEGDIFKPTRDSAIEFLKVAEQIRKGLIDTGKDIKKSFAGIKIEGSADLKKFSKLTEESAKVQKAKIQVDKEEEKIKKRIKTLTDAEVKVKIESANASKAQKDRLAALITIENKQAGTLQKLAARNKLLRSEREKLNLGTTKGIARLKTINAELDKNNDLIQENSDQLKQQKLNVGNYTDSVKDALKSSTLFGRATTFITDAFTKFKGVFTGIIASIKTSVVAFRAQAKATLASAKGQGLLAGGLARVRVAMLAGAAAARVLGKAVKGIGIGLLVAALGALTVAFTQTQKGVDDVSVVMEGLKAASTAVIGAIGQVGLGIFNLFKGLLNGIKGFASEARLTGLQIQRALTFDTDKLKEVDANIASIRKQLSDISSDDSFADGLNQIKDAFSGIAGETGKAFSEGQALGRRILEFREANLLLREDLITSGTLLAIANAQAADTTLSFQQRLDAIEEAGRIQVRVSEAQVTIATNNVKIARERLRFAQDAGRKDIELREVLLTALETQDTAETAFALAQINRDKQRREVALKSLTAEIDIISAGFDSITALTEKQLADTQKTIEERRGILEQLSVDSEKVFDDEIDAIERATKVQIDANDLISTSDAKTLFGKIRALGLADEAEKSLLKAILARQKQTFEEANASELLNLQLEQNLEAIKKIQAQIGQIDIEAQLIELEELAKKQNELFADESVLRNIRRIADEIVEITNNQFALREKSIRDAAGEEIRAANDTIVQEDLRAEEILRINKQLDNDLRKLGIDRAKEIENINAKTLATISKQNEQAVNTIIDVLDAAFEKSNERRRKAIDDELKLREESLARQQALAEKGLDNTLAFEKQKQAEAELERKKQEQREIRRQKVIAFFRLFSELAKTDPNTAATKALAQVLLADVISGAFAEGVEGLDGKGTGTSDSNVALLSKGESVITAAGTNENQGLATAMNTGKVDEYFAKNFLPKYLNEGAFLTKSSAQNMGNSAMLHQLVGVNKRLISLEHTIANKKETSTNLNNLGEVIVSEIEKGFRKTTTYRRRRPRI